MPARRSARRAGTEAAGIPSFRQTYVRDRGIHTTPDYDDVTPDHPVALDLKLTNACNLKCRICGPVASSLWLRGALRGGEHADPHLVENKDYFGPTRSPVTPSTSRCSGGGCPTSTTWS